MKVKLVSHTGRLLREADVPACSPPMGVIVWDRGIFVLQDASESDRERRITLVYREELAYVLQEGL